MIKHTRRSVGDLNWAENFAMNWSFHLFMFSFVNPTPLLEFTRSGKRLAQKATWHRGIEAVIIDRARFELRTRASTVPKNWEFVRVCTICTSPYPYKN